MEQERPSRQRSRTSSSYQLLINKIAQKIFLSKKSIYQFLNSYINPSSGKQKNILFIVGCQRSGTTLMLRAFEKDMSTKVYDEFSKLSSVKGLRFNPLEQVKEQIQKDKAPFIVAKPLVETQNILKILDYFDNSTALWMYRNYKAVASSNLRHFGIKTGINDIRPIAQNEANNWRSERVTEATRSVIIKYFSEAMNPYDAAVLFWFARNSLFFDLGLNKKSNVIMCKYEDLVVSPVEVFKGIYKHVNQKYPGNRITEIIHSDSLTKGEEIPLSPEIESIAERLFVELDKAYSTKSALEFI